MTAPVPTSTDPTTTEPAGATPPTPPATPPAPAVTPDEPLATDGGKKALQAERDRAKALEKQLGELKPLLDFVSQIRGGQAVPDSQKTEVEQMAARLAEVEKTAADERMARMRLEVAGDKKLTAEQATWLKGSTKEELAASADQLLAAFPTAPAGATAPPGPRAPAPDPTQGGNGTPGLSEIDAAIAAAEKAGDMRQVVALKTRKFAESIGK